MEDTFKIGLITKPHGIKGELRVTPLTDDPARFKRLKTVIVDAARKRLDELNKIDKEAGESEDDHDAAL